MSKILISLLVIVIFQLWVICGLAGENLACEKIMKPQINGALQTLEKDGKVSG